MKKLLSFFSILILLGSSGAVSVDTADGKFPVGTAARKIIIDGKLDDWDQRNFAEAAIDLMELDDGVVRYSFCRDADGINIAAEVFDVTPLVNINPPAEVAGWKSDSIQLRLFPEGNIGKYGDCHNFTFWYHTPTRTSCWELQYRGKYLNEFPGAAVKFVPKADGKGYFFEAHLPWALLSKKQPPQEDESWSVLLEVLFGNSTGDEVQARTVSIYNRHPGTFGFREFTLWGRLVFSEPEEQDLKRHKLTELRQRETELQALTSIPVNFKLPADGAVALNIYDPSGKLVRELVQEKPLKKGLNSIQWDGRDYYRNLLPAGKYRVEGLLYQPLKARYIGSVGSSGQPPYETVDGIGGWGSDHTNPLDTLADADGNAYLLWRDISEMGRSLVKVGKDGKTFWRVRPPSRTHFGSFWSLAADDTYIYMIVGQGPVELCRVRKDNGRSAVFSNRTTYITVNNRTMSPEESKILQQGKPYPYGTGLAVRNGKAYVSLYKENEIAVVDIETAKVVRHLKLQSPVGLCFDREGNLYAVSQSEPGKSGVIVRFRGAMGTPENIITVGLLEPWGLAIDFQGNIAVTDMADDVNQVVVFNREGQELKRLGTKGGRPAKGAYVKTDFLRPAGIAATASGGWLVAEESAPKVFSEYGQNGNLLRQWYGPASYGAASFPDLDDPFVIYYKGSFRLPPLIRARQFPDGTWSGPEYYWDIFHMPELAGIMPQFNSLSAVPYMLRHGEFKYIFNGMKAAALLRLNGDELTPVLSLEVDPVNGFPSVKYHNPDKQNLNAPNLENPLLPAENISGFSLEGETKNMDSRGSGELQIIPRSGDSGGWQDSGLHGYRIGHQQKKQGTVNNAYLEWTLPVGKVKGDYDIFLNYAHGGHNPFFKLEVEAGPDSDNLRPVCRNIFRKSPAMSYKFAWLRLGKLSLADTDRVVRLKINSFNSSHVIIDTLILARNDAGKSYPGTRSLFGFGIDDKLNLYFQGGRSIYRIDCRGVASDGTPLYDTANFRLVIKDYCPGVPDADLVNSWRRQVRSIRCDQEGNLYVAWNSGPESSGPHWSAHLTHARLTKYSPEGKRLWETGVKAMGPRRDGEMYNPHVIAGILDNRYVVIADETGMQHVYTTGGFYRGNYMNDIGRSAPPGPYTFTGETFGGIVHFDAKTHRSYAYAGNTDARMFEIENLNGETRFQTSVELTAVHREAIEKLTFSGDKVQGEIARIIDGAKADLTMEKWTGGIPFAFRENDNISGKLLVGVNSTSVLARFEVKDSTPWQNSLEDVYRAFSSGDAVDLYFGPYGPRPKGPLPGDTRIMIVPDALRGVQVIGFKAFTSGEQASQHYQTDVNNHRYQYAGPVKGASGKVEITEDGYIVEVAIPQKFFEGISFAKGRRVRFDADIIFSDDSGRETMRRIFLFSRGALVSMVSDIPTEAWIYPELWGEMFIGGSPARNYVHLDPESLFPEIQAEFLEAEHAQIYSKGFQKLVRSDGKIDMLHDSGGLDFPLYLAWNLPSNIEPGVYRLFVSWAKSGHMQKMKIQASVGAAGDDLRSVGSYDCLNPVSYRFQYHEAPFKVEIKPGDRMLRLDLMTSPAAQLFIDCAALLKD